MAGAAERTHEANLVARHTLDLIESLVRLGASVTLENPESSYLWLYLDFSDDLPFEDLTFTACMFGAPYIKLPVSDAGTGRRRR